MEANFDVNYMELEKIKELVAGLMALDIGEIRGDTNFFTDLGMDSLDLLQLIVEIEACFGVVIGENHIPSIKTAGDAAKLVAGLY